MSARGCDLVVAILDLLQCKLGVLLSGSRAIFQMPLKRTAPRLFDRMQVVFDVRNIYDSNIRLPAGPDHVQRVIPQDGRNVRLRVDVAY